MMSELEKLFSSLNTWIYGAIGTAAIIFALMSLKYFYSLFIAKFWMLVKKNLFASSKMTTTIRDNIKFINDLVLNTRTVLQADRCYVFEFHNGEYFSSRESRWKITQAYESCADGIASQGKDFKDIDVSMLWTSFSVYFSHEKDDLPKGISIVKPNNPECGLKKCPSPKRVYLFDVEKLENRFHKSLLEREGVSYMLHTPILDEKNEVVGVIGVDYINADLDEIANDTEMSCCNLCKAADQIAYSWALLKNKKGR